MDIANTLDGLLSRPSARTSIRAKLRFIAALHLLLVILLIFRASILVDARAAAAVVAAVSDIGLDIHCIADNRLRMFLGRAARVGRIPHKSLNAFAFHSWHLLQGKILHRFADLLPLLVGIASCEDCLVAQTLWSVLDTARTPSLSFLTLWIRMKLYEPYFTFA